MRLASVDTLSTHYRVGQPSKRPVVVNKSNLSNENVRRLIDRRQPARSKLVVLVCGQGAGDIHWDGGREGKELGM